MSEHDATDEGGDLWYVQVAAGEPYMLSLDQLDDAFQAGSVDANTLVCEVGSSEWQRLGEVAGLDEAPPEPAPVSIATGPLPLTTSYSPVSMSPYSTAPVAGDLDLDLDANPFRAKKSRKGRWVAALAVLGALGFGATKLRLPNPAAPTVAASPALDNAMATLNAERRATEPPRAAEPPPVATEPAKASPVSQLSEDTKKALLEADKKLAAKQAAKAASRPPPPPARTSRHKSSGEKVFHKGGSQYDPLNSSL